jgi:hypothetical protein
LTCGIEIIKEMRQKKHSHNVNYFSKFDQETCYWAGFIAADGCIYPKENKVKLRLGSLDREHLERFREVIEYSGDIYDEPNYPSSEINIYSAVQVISDLYRYYNITGRKSLTLKPPNLTEHLWSKCYIIGYIDGDGCISEKQGNSLGLDILGTLEMLFFIKNKFEVWYPRKKNPQDIYCRGKFYRFAVSGKRAVHILTDLLSFDVPRLERKWNKVADYIGRCGSK